MRAPTRGRTQVSGRRAALALALGAVAASPAAPVTGAAQGVLVSGQVTAEDKRPLLSASLAIVREDAAPATTPDVATFQPDGRFTFRSVQPGRYIIRARGETDPRGVTLFATYRVTVENRDVANVTMLLSRGAVLTGLLVRRNVRGTRAPAYSGLRVRAPLNDGSNFGDALTGRVDGSGRFAIRGLIAGAHAISVEGLPSPWVVEKIEQDGKDITNLPLQVDGPVELRGVRITIADVAPPAPPR